MNAAAAAAVIAVSVGVVAWRSSAAERGAGPVVTPVRTSPPVRTSRPVRNTSAAVGTSAAGGADLRPDGEVDRSPTGGDSRPADRSAGRMAEAPPPGSTGGFGERTCLECHLGNAVNAFGGRVGLDGLTQRYVPGGAYVLTVVLEADETSVAGFQLTARFADGPNGGRDAGTVAPVDERTMLTDSAGVSYLHQSPVGSHTSDPAGSSWSVGWTAPRSTDPVVFHIAANSGNGDKSPLGDLVYVIDTTIAAAR